MARRPKGLKTRGVFRTEGLEETLGAMEAPELTHTLARALAKSAAVIQTEITTKQIIRSSRGPVHPKRITSRSGELRRSISGGRGVDLSRARKRRGASIDVGSDLVYAAVHEFGSPKLNIPIRKFIEPGFEKSRKKVETIFLQEWKRSVFSA